MLYYFLTLYYIIMLQPMDWNTKGMDDPQKWWMQMIEVTKIIEILL